MGATPIHTTLFIESSIDRSVWKQRKEHLLFAGFSSICLRLIFIPKQHLSWIKNTLKPQSFAYHPNSLTSTLLSFREQTKRNHAKIIFISFPPVFFFHFMITTNAFLSFDAYLNTCWAQIKRRQKKQTHGRIESTLKSLKHTLMWTRCGLKSSPLEVCVEWKMF